jgi:hypothetical protein
MRTSLMLLITAVLIAGCASKSTNKRTGDGTSGVGAGGQGSSSGGSSGGGDDATGGTDSIAGDSGAGGVNGGEAGTGGGGDAGSSVGGDATNGGFAGSSTGTGGTSGGAGGSGGVSGGGASGGGTSGSGGKSSGGSAGAGGSGGAGGTFHVFLLLGASNMAGYPRAQAADKQEDPRIRVLGYDDCMETGRQTDVWDTAAPPLHECSNGAIGPGDHFAKALLPILPSSDTIGLVPCAISGAEIFAYSRLEYGFIVGRARAALQAGGAIEGILFHQGEADTIDVDWTRHVSTLVVALRTELGIPNAPFLAGELAYQGNGASLNILVRNLPAAISDTWVVSADGLAVDSADTENLFFGHDAQVELGRRYAAKLIQARGW